MKNKRFVNWIILLMSVSLTAIIVMQTIQLVNSYNKSKESIDRGVSQAITNTLEALQKQDAIIFVYDKLTGNNYGVIDSVFPLDPYMLHNTSQANIVNVTENSYQIQIQNFPGMSISQLGYSFFSDFAHPRDIFDIEQFLFQDFEEKKQRLQSILGQLEQEFLHRQIPIEKRFNTETISSVLYQSLLEQGLNLNFEFAIIDENNLTKIKSSGFSKSNISDSYKFNLIPGSIFSNPDVFLVYFPTKRKYAFQSMIAQIGTSFLLTLLFIFTFGVSLFALLRQKKISEVKTDFINNMTHEFKTPIATIKLAASALKNDKTRSDIATSEHMIDIITQETNRMNQHVEQVLQMAVMERQSIKIQKNKESINEVIREAVNNYELVVEEKGGKIDVCYPIDDITVNLDRDLIINVFNNILDNAIKYSKDYPEIHISARGKGNLLLIAIKDKGIGMTRDVQTRIFERFYRAPTGNVHNIKGFGLGLNYAKEIINAHKGDIRVKSNPDRGSTFTIVLPIK